MELDDYNTFLSTVLENPKSDNARANFECGFKELMVRYSCEKGDNNLFDDFLESGLNMDGPSIIWKNGYKNKNKKEYEYQDNNEDDENNEDEKVNTKNTYEREHPLITACRNGNLYIVKKLWKYFNVQGFMWNDFKPLIVACNNDHVDIVEFFLPDFNCEIYYRLQINYQNKIERKVNNNRIPDPNPNPKMASSGPAISDIFRAAAHNFSVNVVKYLVNLSKSLETPINFFADCDENINYNNDKNLLGDYRSSFDSEKFDRFIEYVFTEETLYSRLDAYGEIYSLIKVYMIDSNVNIMKLLVSVKNNFVMSDIRILSMCFNEMHKMVAPDIFLEYILSDEFSSSIKYTITPEYLLDRINRSSPKVTKEKHRIHIRTILQSKYFESVTNDLLRKYLARMRYSHYLNRTFYLYRKIEEIFIDIFGPNCTKKQKNIVKKDIIKKDNQKTTKKYKNYKNFKNNKIIKKIVKNNTKNIFDEEYENELFDFSH